MPCIPWQLPHVEMRVNEVIARQEMLARDMACRGAAAAAADSYAWQGCYRGHLCSQSNVVYGKQITLLSSSRHVK